MKHSVIDIGSNSMRMTVYEINGTAFKILFKEKIMAGLAGYVENGSLSEDGIRCAYNSLLNFKNTLELLGLQERISVFATASLRNIDNTEEVLRTITAATGFHIDVISGEEEALLGYTGAMEELHQEHGVFIDIGGASTEIALFSNQQLSFLKSYPVGSLKLYRDCVKKILPGNGSIKRIQETLQSELPASLFEQLGKQDHLIGTGGTARSILKMAKRLCHLDDNTNTFSAKNIREIKELFLGDSRICTDMILKTDPARIHTIIPGFLILDHISENFAIDKITVSNYGAREGYLCQKIMNPQ